MNWVTGYGDAFGLNSNISHPLSGIRDKDGEIYHFNIIVEQYALFICAKIRITFIPQLCSSELQAAIADFCFLFRRQHSYYLD